MTKRRKKRPSAEARQHFRRGRILAAKGQTERAIDSLRTALDVDPNYPEALIQLAITYDRAGGEHATEAISCLQQAIALDNTIARAHYNLGAMLSGRGDRTDEAIAAFERAVELDPDSLKSLYGLSVQWSRKGDSEKAADYYRRSRRVESKKDETDPKPGSEENEEQEIAPAPVLRITFLQ